MNGRSARVQAPHQALQVVPVKRMEEDLTPGMWAILIITATAGILLSFAALLGWVAWLQIATGLVWLVGLGVSLFSPTGSLGATALASGAARGEPSGASFASFSTK